MNFRNLIDKQLACSAYAGISFSPEKRGEMVVNDFSIMMEADKSKILSWDSEAHGLVTEHANFCANKYQEWLSAKSRCLSPMITGPARFPVARNNKRNQSEHNKNLAFDEARKKSLKRIKKKIFPFGDGSIIQGNDPQAILKLIEKKEHLISEIRIMKTVNALAKADMPNKVAFLMKAGLSENQANFYLSEKIHFPPYAIKNAKARLKHVTERVENLEKQANIGEVEIKGDSCTVQVSASQHRVIIIFDEKPDHDLITTIKKRGFKYSPTRNTWSRILTNSAIYATEQLFSVDLSHTYI